MRVLFVCSQNRLRSPTASAVFADWPGIEVCSAGVDADARVPVDESMLLWADLVVCMERSHRLALRERWRDAFERRRVVTLDIADDYEFMQPELVSELRATVPIYLRPRAL